MTYEALREMADANPSEMVCTARWILCLTTSRLEELAACAVESPT